MAEATKIREYNSERMMGIALAIYEAVVRKCTDEQRVCYMNVEEVFDAMALLGGVMLSTGPASRSQTKLRDVTTKFGKNVAERARQAKAEGSSRLFDIVLDEKDAFH